MTISLDELMEITPDVITDARGTSCPGPILAAKKAVGRLAVGSIMEVQATDSGTKKDLPAWCKKMGFDYLGDFDHAGYIRLFLRKSK